MSNLIDAGELKENLIRCELNRLAYDVVDREISYMTPVKAIPIPEGATNGDVIKQVFAQYGLKVRCFPNEVIVDMTALAVDGIIPNMAFGLDWWFSPYKGE